MLSFYNTAKQKTIVISDGAQEKSSVAFFIKKDHHLLFDKPLHIADDMRYV
jgi:hypothetical protein